MPYEFFIREAIEAALRRGATRPPRPNQLYNVLGMPHLEERWEEHWKAVGPVSSLPQYRVEAFRGLPAQVDHQNWVVETLKARNATPYAIAKACFVDRILPVERAEAAFGAYRMELASRESAGMETEPMPALRARDFLPSCFGVPHAHAPEELICAGCHVRAVCAKLEGKVRAKLAERHGSECPRDDERRAQVRKRVARYRARKALARAGSRKPGGAPYREVDLQSRDVIRDRE